MKLAEMLSLFRTSHPIGDGMLLKSFLAFRKLIEKIPEYDVEDTVCTCTEVSFVARREEIGVVELVSEPYYHRVEFNVSSEPWDELFPVEMIEEIEIQVHTGLFVVKLLRNYSEKAKGVLIFEEETGQKIHQPMLVMTIPKK